MAPASGRLSWDIESVAVETADDYEAKRGC